MASRNAIILRKRSVMAFFFGTHENQQTEIHKRALDVINIREMNSPSGALFLATIDREFRLPFAPILRHKVRHIDDKHSKHSLSNETIMIDIVPHKTQSINTGTNTVWHARGGIVFKYYCLFWHAQKDTRPQEHNREEENFSTTSTAN